MRVLGSILLVSGTTLGAGILAIPMVTLTLGFKLSLLLLLLCWCVMTITGLMLVDFLVQFPEGTNFSSMAFHTMGYLGQALAVITYFGFLYALLSSYIAGGASLFTEIINTIFNFKITTTLSALIFTLTLGSFIYFGINYVDYANRILISIKGLVFLILVSLLTPNINANYLGSDIKPGTSWLATLPILVTAFTFHAVIPNVRDYLHSDAALIKRVLFTGSFISLLIYFIWQTAIFGNIPSVEIPNENLSIFFLQIQKLLHTPYLSICIRIFTNVAVTTSFLGVAIALNHFIHDKMQLDKVNVKQNLLGCTLTFIPPLLLASVFPNGFILALRYASIFIIILMIIIPIFMKATLLSKNDKLQVIRHVTCSIFLIIFSLFTIGIQFI